MAVSASNSGETQAPTEPDPGLPEWSEFFSHISTFLRACGRQFELASESYAEYAIERLTVITTGVHNVLQLIQEANRPALRGIEQQLEDLEQILQSALNIWTDYYDSMDLSSQYTSPVLSRQEGARGRPCFMIFKEQLEYLRSLSFTWVSISKMVLVSRMTVYRRRVAYGLLNEPSSAISDEDLTTLVRQTIAQHPCVGQSFIWGVIRSQGYSVTRERVRRTIRQCDPINTTLRWGGVLTPRQPYSVPGPNSLWHLGELVQCT